MDLFDVPNEALEDWGIPVQVTPLDGSPAYPITALFGPIVEQVQLGQARGHAATHRFRCLPEVAANLVEGDILTPEGGSNYAVFEVLPIPNRLTRVFVVER